jgi:hypothetical protein
MFYRSYKSTGTLEKLKSISSSPRDVEPLHYARGRVPYIHGTNPDTLVVSYCNAARLDTPLRFFCAYFPLNGRFT